MVGILPRFGRYSSCKQPGVTLLRETAMPKRLAVVLALAFLPPAFAGEEPGRLPPSGASAPPMAPAAATLGQAGEVPALRAGEPSPARKPARGCANAELEFCIGADGRINVPGARKFMPGIPGLTPERLTVKRNGIVLGYSF